MLNLTPLEIIKTWGLFGSTVDQVVHNEQARNQIELIALGIALSYYGHKCWFDPVYKTLVHPYDQRPAFNVKVISPESLLELQDGITDEVGSIVASLVVPRFFQYCGMFIPPTAIVLKVSDKTQYSVVGEITRLLDFLFVTGAGHSTYWMKQYLEVLRGHDTPILSCTREELLERYEVHRLDVLEITGRTDTPCDRYFGIIGVFLETGNWLSLPANLASNARTESAWKNQEPIVPGWKYLIPPYPNRDRLEHVFECLYGKKYGSLDYQF